MSSREHKKHPAAASPWLMAAVNGQGTLSTLAGYRESVLLQELAHVDNAQGGRDFTFAIWLITGHGPGGVGPTVDYDASQKLWIRIDVPDGEPFTHASLQDHLTEFFRTNPNLPPDTGVIVH